MVVLGLAGVLLLVLIFIGRGLLRGSGSLPGGLPGPRSGGGGVLLLLAVALLLLLFVRSLLLFFFLLLLPFFLFRERLLARLRFGAVGEFHVGREVVLDDVHPATRGPVQLLPEHAVLVLHRQLDRRAASGPVGNPDGRLDTEEGSPRVLAVSAAKTLLDCLDGEDAERVGGDTVLQLPQGRRLGDVDAPPVRSDDEVARTRLDDEILHGHPRKPSRH